VATTRSRPPRGREQARHASGGVAADHTGKIYAAAITGAAIILAFLTLTPTGHVVDAAVQHFMLYYAGVFALITLCASVGLGLVATDRMILRPGHRVFLQLAHRAVSFGAVAFLIVHILTEIMAQRVHALDAFIPFLSPFRTFYIGLGTIASDLIILLAITGIYRKRFTTNGTAWRWRAIHYTSYAAFVFGVWHGLLGGRPGKPYVDWSYGLVIALVAIGLAVRILASSLRPKESLSALPVSEATSSGSAPMRAVSMFAQLGMARAAASGRAGGLVTDGARRGVLTASSRSSGAVPVLAALSAPMAGQVVSGPATDPMRVAGAGAGSWRAEPVYEPGYDGPPRYRGAPRDPSTGPQPRAATGPLPRSTTGPLPRAGTGPLPRAASGPMPRAASGPLPRAASGPLPRAGTGPLPRAASGPMPRATTGPLPRPGYRSRPPAPAGPMPGSTPPGRGGIGGGVGGAVRNMGNEMPPAAGENPWDTGVDPELRRREPGPGMPGYRGGQPRGDDPYAGDPYATGPYATDHFAPPPQGDIPHGGNPYGGYPYGWYGRR
jgi:hypothetical protein